MKTISTIICTGDRVKYFDRYATIGQYRKGKIAVHVSLGGVSGMTEEISTRKINTLLKGGAMAIIPFYKTNAGEGVTFSNEKGNHWGNIVIYSTSPVNNNSIPCKWAEIPAKSFINGYGTK